MTFELPRSATIAAACAALLALPLFVGCNTAAYEERLQAATRRLSIDNQFVDLEPTETLIAEIKTESGSGARVSFRKPRIFEQPANGPEAANPDDKSQPIPPQRLLPYPLAEFPGFRFSYEVQQRVSKLGLQLFYIYLGAQPTDEAAGQKILEALRPGITDADPEALDWSTVSVQTPDGTSQVWKQLKVRGKHQFFVQGNNIATEIPALLTVMMREQAGVQVFFAYRTTELAGPQIDAERAAMGAVGTIRIVPAKIE